MCLGDSGVLTTIQCLGNSSVTVRSGALKIDVKPHPLIYRRHGSPMGKNLNPDLNWIQTHIPLNTESSDGSKMQDGCTSLRGEIMHEEELAKEFWQSSLV